MAQPIQQPTRSVTERLDASWRPPTDQLRHGGYTVELVVNAILLYAAHHLLPWGVPFLTPAFADVLWAIDLSLGAAIIANALFMAYDPAWFRQLSQAGLDFFSLVSTYTLYRVFPFDFELAWWNDVAAGVLVVAMVATTIGFIVHVVRATSDGFAYVVAAR
jgi:hypothetical protein